MPKYRNTGKSTWYVVPACFADTRAPVVQVIRGVVTNATGAIAIGTASALKASAAYASSVLATYGAYYGPIADTLYQSVLPLQAAMTPRDAGKRY